MLKIGELAALADLTVRTLHHYDNIGLLRPSARSDAGYRLYSRDDVARLHQIQALRSFGMSLADIGLALDSPAGSPLAVVDRQLAELDQRIADAQRLRTQLVHVRTQLAAGGSPDMSTWLTTLELTMERLSTYEKYFTQEELQRLRIMTDEVARTQTQKLVEQASGLMQSQVPPDAPAAKAFALRWLQAFEDNTEGDAELQVKMNTMAMREQEAVGLPKPLLHYIYAAVGELKGDVWRKYLRPETYERMKRHYITRGGEWTGLVQRVLDTKRIDPEGKSPASREVAHAWMALFYDMVGTDPQDIADFRRASAAEPLLNMGTGIKGEVLDWLRQMARPDA